MASDGGSADGNQDGHAADGFSLAGSEATTTTRDTDAHTHSPSKDPRRTSFVAIRKTFGRTISQGKKSVFKEYEEIKGRPTLKFANYTVPGLQIRGSKFQSLN